MRREPESEERRGRVNIADDRGSSCSTADQQLAGLEGIMLASSLFFLRLYPAFNASVFRLLTFFSLLGDLQWRRSKRTWCKGKFDGSGIFSRD